MLSAHCLNFHQLFTSWISLKQPSSKKDSNQKETTSIISLPFLTVKKQQDLSSLINITSQETGRLSLCLTYFV